MPPPCCMVSAASRRWSKMLPRSSAMSPMTKQLNNVTRRSDPAPDSIRPAGRNRKSCSASKNRCSQCLGSGSVCARARATRRQVSSMVTSTAVPSIAFSRYLASQIWREMGAMRSKATSMFISTTLPCFLAIPTFLPSLPTDKRAAVAGEGCHWTSTWHPHPDTRISSSSVVNTVNCSSKSHSPSSPRSPSTITPSRCC
jgi:hypothetical protein